MTLFKLPLLLYVKNWASFYHFYFHLSFRKVLCESVLFFIIKVFHKDVLSSIIICRHLSLTYYTQMYCKKADYYLAKLAALRQVSVRHVKETNKGLN